MAEGKSTSDQVTSRCDSRAAQADDRHTHSHAHDHSHGHTHGHHGVTACMAERNEKRLLWATVLTASFMIVELVGGIIAGSLALIADAAHMASDTAALALAYAAFRFSRWPADDQRTFGFHRLQVLAAFANGLTLVILSGWILFEAILRLIEPQPVLAGPMLIVAVAGLVANLVVFALLHSADRNNLNIKGAMFHVLGDLAGSVAAIGAAIVIWLSGWLPIDPLLSILVTILVLRAAWRLIKDASHILLEGTPTHLDIDDLRSDLTENVPGVTAVDHIHAWALTQERPLMTLHMRIKPDHDPSMVLSAIKARLKARYRIEHSTIEIEWPK